MVAVMKRLTRLPVERLLTKLEDIPSDSRTTPFVPPLKNVPRDLSRLEFRMDDSCAYVTPLVVGLFGLPVPSTQFVFAIQRISNEPTPPSNMVLLTSVCSVTFRSEERRVGKECRSPRSP